MVNVASECGYTDHNYKLLTQLQEDFRKGFTVLAFPCNQFSQQEPGNNQEIFSFVNKTYNINFPIFSKILVDGDAPSDVYQYLFGKMGQRPSWNFCKYLVNQHGEVVQFFSVTADFKEIRLSIEYLLRKANRL